MLKVNAVCQETLKSQRMHTKMTFEDI